MDPTISAGKEAAPLTVTLEPAAEAPAPARAAGPRPLGGLLEAVLDGRVETRGPADPLLDQFLREPSFPRALAFYVENSRSRLPARATKRDVARLLNREIAQIDALLSRQINAILHHPSFQRLEASWRGLQFLVGKTPEGEPKGQESVKIRVLSATWRELSRDQQNALEFDQSQLFRKVYEEEFGTPGGEPYGVLLADYEIHHKPSSHHPYDDLDTLTKLTGVAAASFAPLIAGVHPSFFDLERFTELEKPLDLTRTFEQLEYLKWRSLRQSEDARFVGLTVPRVLMRLPYTDDGSRTDDFRFKEDVEDPSRGQYLWGTAVYAFGSVLIRSFTESGWFASIRGAPRGIDGGGIVTGLPVHSFSTDKLGVAPKVSTDVIITDAQEKELGELGFIPLCHCQDTEYSTFFGNQSIQKPLKYDELPATINARLSSMLQYMFCVSRFSHYVKVISRDKLGALNGAGDCEEYLRKWLMRYTTANDNAGIELKSKYPLREARVALRDRPGKPGSYNCIIHLRPHFQLDQLQMAVKLRTELAPARS
jgi:type VI secretion system protein ImpD